MEDVTAAAAVGSTTIRGALMTKMTNNIQEKHQLMPGKMFISGKKNDEELFFFLISGLFHASKAKLGNTMTSNFWTSPVLILSNRVSGI